MIVVHAYNAASHSLGVALHFGSDIFWMVIYLQYMNSKLQTPSYHMFLMVVVYGYNAASHSLGVALHSGSGWLCRDHFFDIPKPLFVLEN